MKELKKRKKIYRRKRNKDKNKKTMMTAMTTKAELIVVNKDMTFALLLSYL